MGMSEEPAGVALRSGSLVVYEPRTAGDHEGYRIGVVVGPVVREPASGRLWVGVRLSRHAIPGAPLDLIDVASIVDASPPHDSDR
jgi:hypothetical protein